MRLAKKPVFFMLTCTAVILFLILLLQPFTIYAFRDKIAVLFPRGVIALEERNLLFIIQGLMLLVIIPVYVLTFAFSWKYRAHSDSEYDPELSDNHVAEIVWWGLPLVITLIIATLTWFKTYELDPYKSIESKNPPLTIQVVALQWKWLFIYPEEKIATVNFLQIPTDRPIHFEITADAPMNSFWIPHLGGQIYAMPKMKTELNLIANQAGDFMGSSANISGELFADMHFITRATVDKEYLEWVETAKKSAAILNWESYESLAKPGAIPSPITYQLSGDNLFNQIIMKYMHPQPK